MLSQRAVNFTIRLQALQDRIIQAATGQIIPTAVEIIQAEGDQSTQGRNHSIIQMVTGAIRVTIRHLRIILITLQVTTTTTTVMIKMTPIVLLMILVMTIQMIIVPLVIPAKSPKMKSNPNQALLHYRLYLLPQDFISRED